MALRNLQVSRGECSNMGPKEDLKYDFVCYYCLRAREASSLSHFDPLDVADEFSEVVPICIECVYSMCLGEQEIEEE